MDWHAERCGTSRTCVLHPYQAIVDTGGGGLGSRKLTVTELIVRMLPKLRNVYAEGIAGFVAFLDYSKRLSAKGMMLLCGGNTGRQETVCVQALLQRDQTGGDENNTSAQREQQDKSFCGESQLQLAIPSCLDSITFVGAVINAACLTLSFSVQEATQIELCVVEAVVNAIKHAYAGRPDHIVEIRVSAQADRLVLQVCDYGLAMTREIPTSLDFDPSDIAQVPEGGMGLFLMHALMDEVSYVSSQGANVLTMTRRLST